MHEVLYYVGFSDTGDEARRKAGELRELMAALSPYYRYHVLRRWPTALEEPIRLDYINVGPVDPFGTIAVMWTDGVQLFPPESGPAASTFASALQENRHNK